MAVLVHSAVAVGLNIVPVIIEAALGHGFSGLQIIGLSHDVCRDARERIRAGIESLGLSLPARRLIISIRPSDVLKNFKGGLEHLDLPCAVALAGALAEQSNAPKSSQLNTKKIHTTLHQYEFFFAGQLTLSGGILPQANALPLELVAVESASTRHHFFSNSRAVCSEAHSQKNWHTTTHLQDCLRRLENWQSNSKTASQQAASQTNEHKEFVRISDNLGSQENQDQLIKTTLEQFASIPALGLALFISAAGRHHLLLSGSPGCGKTHALKAFKSLLPPLTHREKLNVALIHNRTAEAITERPFRTPHHSASGAALLGGSQLQPGEVSLAHHGALLLDELAEFHRSTLEALREPLDEQQISLSRARGQVVLPAHFLLLAATNPCPCGNFFSLTRACRCATAAPLKYQQKLSGPLLERFSILLLVDSILPSAQSASFPHSPNLITFANLWFESFRTDPIPWVKRFRNAQNTFWSESKTQETYDVLDAIENDPRSIRWSTRTKVQIAHLVSTLTALFNDKAALCLSQSEAIQLGLELRSFELYLQHDVQLLTPQQNNLQLQNVR